MTTFVTRLTDPVVWSADPAPGGLVAILVLVALLVEGELLRSVRGPRTETQTATVTAVVVPLLIAFVVVVVTRLGELR